VHQNNILIYIQQDTLHSLFYLEIALHVSGGRGQLKCDGTRAETRFRLSAKRTSPFTWRKRQFSRLLAADVCASAIVLLDIPCSEVVWRILVTHSIRQFPLHFPSLALPCAITFQLDSTTTHHQKRKQLYLQHLVFVTPLLLSAAVVEVLTLVWVCYGWRTPPTAHSNQFQLFHDSGR